MTVTNSLHQPATVRAEAPKSPVIQVQPLGFPWPTIDPFLFCVYHDDAYPAGDGHLAPAASLAGRQIGQDFSRKDGWCMYHGQTVPGFPPHPHRGFETVTIVRKGLVDHSDSLGATARFGRGDVQWLTAGSGIVHSEMFPLLKQDEANPLELFQIWLNLPAASKMASPHFTMFWSQDIPRITATDAQGRRTEVAVIAGTLQGEPAQKEAKALPPPPDSWASAADAHLAIWTLRMAPGARWTLPAAKGDSTRRQLYFFKGAAVQVGGQAISDACAVEVRAGQDIELVNTGATEAEFLMLQGRPIAEPVVQYGPFVMNTQAQIVQTMDDYQRTRFGGWSFDDAAPVHGHDPARFARHPDGREERPAEVPGA